jgi:hypothetical protein
MRILARGPSGSARAVYDPNNMWGGNLSSVRAIPGGLDLYATFSGYGGMGSAVRFLIEDGELVFKTDCAAGTPRRVPRWLVENQPAALHEAFAAMHGVARMEADRFDPVALIQAVNVLQSLGQDSAVAALRGFLPQKGQVDWRSERDLDPVHLILRLLFIPKDMSYPIPPLRQGLAVDLPEDVLKEVPDFPLVSVHGIPFLLAPRQGRYVYEGKAEDPRGHLDWCLEHAVFREAPLQPDADPLTAGEELISSRLWGALRASPSDTQIGGLESLRMQMLVALGRVVPATEDWCRLGGRTPYGKAPETGEEYWIRRRLALKAEAPVWDPSWQDFVGVRYVQRR